MKLRNIVLWVGLVFSTHADGNFDELLAQKRRPSLRQLLETIDKVGSFPFRNQCVLQFPFKLLHEKGLQIIADLEFAFPGAKWAPLGRDASFVGDILESYEIRNQMHGRVVRIDGSKATFQNVKNRKKILSIPGLIDENGFPSVKFVLLDATHWEKSSQMRILLSIVYSRFQMTERKKLLPFVNAVAIGNKASEFNRINPLMDIEVFWKTLSFTPAPSAIVSTAHEFSYPIFQWHESFGEIAVDEDSIERVQVGSPKQRDEREQVLCWMYWTWKTVSSDRFPRAAPPRAEPRNDPWAELWTNSWTENDAKIPIEFKHTDANLNSESSCILL